MVYWLVLFFLVVERYCVMKIMGRVVISGISSVGVVVLFRCLFDVN